MINREQQKWLNHLNDSDSIKIIPYSQKPKEAFRKIKSELIKVLGNTPISLKGSTRLKISGQGEVDLYIPVAKKDFNLYLEKLISYLGKPGTVYPLNRVRFVKYIDNIKVEIFLINRNGQDWKNSVKFENYLRRHPEALKKYEALKKVNEGKSTKEYYTQKIKFINEILSK